MQKIIQLIREEFGVIQWRWQLARLFMWLFPVHSGNRFRAVAMRLAGFQIGRGTFIQGMPTIFGPGKLGPRLTVGEGCVFSIRIFFDLAAPITIGNAVHIGPRTMLITGGHDIGPPTRRSGKTARKPIQINNGAWLGTRCTILPGVTIGEGAVVAAGSVVIRDVPPHTLVAGIPAVIKKQLSESEEDHISQKDSI